MTQTFTSPQRMMPTYECLVMNLRSSNPKWNRNSMMKKKLPSLEYKYLIRPKSSFNQPILIYPTRHRLFKRMNHNLLPNLDAEAVPWEPGTGLPAQFELSIRMQQYLPMSDPKMPQTQGYSAQHKGTNGPPTERWN